MLFLNHSFGVGQIIWRRDFHPSRGAARPNRRSSQSRFIRVPLPCPPADRNKSTAKIFTPAYRMVANENDEKRKIRQARKQQPIELDFVILQSSPANSNARVLNLSCQARPSPRRKPSPVLTTVVCTADVRNSPIHRNRQETEVLPGAKPILARFLPIDKPYVRIVNVYPELRNQTAHEEMFKMSAIEKKSRCARKTARHSGRRS